MTGKCEEKKEGAATPVRSGKGQAGDQPHGPTIGGSGLLGVGDAPITPDPCVPLASSVLMPVAVPNVRLKGPFGAFR